MLLPHSGDLVGLVSERERLLRDGLVLALGAAQFDAILGIVKTNDLTSLRLAEDVLEALEVLLPTVMESSTTRVSITPLMAVLMSKL